MKKYIAILFLLPVMAFAQNNININGGVTHYAWAAQGSNYGSDSIHVIGDFNLFQPGRFSRFDSVAFKVSYEDSLRAALHITLLNAFGTVTDTASISQVNGDFQIDVTAAGQTIYPWFAIHNALKDKLKGASILRVKAIVYAVGTEVQKSNKRINVKAIPYE